MAIQKYTESTSKKGDLSVLLRLRNVRLSFPQLWEKKQFADGKPEYSAQFLIEKGTEEFKLATTAYKRICETRFGGKEPKDLKYRCVKSCSEFDYDGYEDDMIVLVAKGKENAPHVLDKDLTPLLKGSSRPYAGCYVNAVVQVYGWKAPHGFGVGADLKAVQFVRDGEPFGSRGMEIEDMFDVEDGDDDDDSGLF